MKRLLRIWATAVLLLAIGPVDVGATEAAAPDWKVYESRDGVELAEGRVDGSRVLALRVRTRLDAPIWKLAAALTDQSRSREWVDRLKEVRLVRRLGPRAYVEYTVFDSPFIIADRDFLFRSEFELDPVARRFQLRSESVEDPAVPPADGRVRGWTRARYDFRGAADGRSTDVDLELHVDPRGSLPKWIVNLFQRGFPRRTLDRIRAQIAKPDLDFASGLREELAPLRTLTK